MLRIDRTRQGQQEFYHKNVEEEEAMTTTRPALCNIYCKIVLLC
jgi:hypothetical protein